VRPQEQSFLQQQIARVEQELQRLTRHLEAVPDDARAYVQCGMASFKLGRLAAAIQAFDTAERCNPALTPYLWQRGLAYYYAERFAEGAQQFAIDLTVNAHDVEETVWRYLCQARVQGAAAARAQLLPVRNDPRLVMHGVYRLFAGTYDVEEFCAQYGTAGADARFYSALYAGLYYEAAQEHEKAQYYITHAAQMHRVEDYMGWVALVHCQQRDWDTQ
jgi:tetratricopeptide (TPR) repeat protein